MHRYSALACVILSGLPLAAIAGPVPETVPADSFIVQHVGSLTQLHRQVSLDPVVRLRLARHFHTSAPAMARYIQDNLVLKKITVARRYPVYCINRSGQEYVINSRLVAGTPVFVMRSTGRPILKLACGNPMAAALPPVVTKVSPYQSPEIAAVAKPVPAPAIPALVSNGPVLVAMNDTPGVVVMPTTRVAGYIGALPALHGGSGFPLGFLAGIPVLAALTSHSGGNNSGTTGTTGTTGSDTNGNNTLGTGTNGNNTNGNSTGGNDTLGTSTGGTGVTPVPEPSTPAAFIVGGLGLLFLVSGAKRRRAKSH